MPNFNISVTKNTVDSSNIPSESICMISGSWDLTLNGKIGPGCTITKKGNGDLKINGFVGNGVIFNLSGNGKIIFAQKPPADVIMNGSNFVVPGGLFSKNPSSANSVTNFGLALGPKQFSVPSSGSVAIGSITGGIGVNHNYSKKRASFFSANEGPRYACLQGDGSQSSISIGNTTYDCEIKNSVITITRNGVPTQYKGNSSYIKANGQVVIDEVLVTPNDSRIIPIKKIKIEVAEESSADLLRTV